MPVAREEKHFERFRRFQREGFRKYLRHYVDEMHAYAPGLEIAAVPFDMGQRYGTGRATVMRDFLDGLVRRLMPGVKIHDIVEVTCAG